MDFSFMLEPYGQSTVAIYQSTCATTLQGSLICFFELQDKPVMYATINANTLTIFLINPYYSIESFLSEIPTNSADLTSPLYLFDYDHICLKRYDIEYNTHLEEFFGNYTIQEIDSDDFETLEDFYSYTLPECYGSFFTLEMYKRFAKSKDLYEICNFVRSVMFSKVVLVIDTFSTFSMLPNYDNDIVVICSGKAPVSLPAGSCLIDLQTLGLDEYSDIMLFTIFRDTGFTTYYLNNTSIQGQQAFRQFIERSLQIFDIIYVLNADFDHRFLPQFKNFVDIRFNKYSYWAATRKLVHLPRFHLEIDPGSGKNIPIWIKSYQIEKEDLWKELVLQRTVTNILSKVAILSSNELKLPYSDPILADVRRLLPTGDFTNLFLESNYIFKKKILFYPTELFNTFNKRFNEFNEMYIDNLIISEE